MKMISWYILGIIAISIMSYSGFLYWQYLAIHPSTDNAYINANRIEVNANISGQVSKLVIKDNQLVKKGDLLFTIDDRASKIALQKAEANLKLTHLKLRAEEDAVAVAQANIAQAKAQLLLEQKNAQRILALVKDGKSAQSEGDKAKASLDVSEANLAACESQYQKALMDLGEPGENNAQLLQAKAQLKQAKLDLTYTYVKAPANGKVTHFSLRPGDMIQRGQTVFTIIEQDQWWVDANYKETKLEHIKSGQTATVTIDMYPDHPLKGKVESISGGTGAMFSILPAENAAGNWVKVTQRIPVKIVLQDVDIPLAIGASATVTIDTK